MSLEWRNQASLSNYPFTSESTLVDLAGTSRLSRDDIVDIVLYRLLESEENPYLSAITISDGNISIQFSSDDLVIAEFFGDRSASLGTVGRLTGIHGEDRGHIVFGDNASTFFSSIIPGSEVLFGPEGATLMDTCTLAPVTAQVSTLVIGGIPLFGRVRLKAGTGFQFVKQGENGVVVHAVGAQVDGECGLGLPIQKINGVSPTSSGGIQIKEEEFASPSEEEPERQILRVRQIEYGIVISLPELKDKP